jgi:hypothetical protein
MRFLFTHRRRCGSFLLPGDASMGKAPWQCICRKVNGLYRCEGPVAWLASSSMRAAAGREPVEGPFRLLAALRPLPHIILPPATGRSSRRGMVAACSTPGSLAQPHLTWEAAALYRLGTRVGAPRVPPCTATVRWREFVTSGLFGIAQLHL